MTRLLTALGVLVLLGCSVAPAESVPAIGSATCAIMPATDACSVPVECDGPEGIKQITADVSAKLNARAQAHTGHAASATCTRTDGTNSAFCCKEIDP